MTGLTMTNTKVKTHIEAYTHDRPGKAESLFCRLNLRSPDTMSSPPTGKAGSALSAGQIAAAFAMGHTRVPEAERCLGPTVTRDAMYRLALYKHTGDAQAGRLLVYDAMGILITYANRDGWKPEKRGILTAASKIAIEDICSPAKYAGWSTRLWAEALGLPDHSAWARRWRDRYMALRDCMQLLDSAGEEHIERFI